MFFFEYRRFLLRLDKKMSTLLVPDNLHVSLLFRILVWILALREKKIYSNYKDDDSIQVLYVKLSVHI